MNTKIRAMRTCWADAIVVDRADLPKVCVDTCGQPCIPGVTPEIRTQSAEKARYLAGCWLALAEYLDAHPPVDEAQVEALASILAQVGDDGTWAIDWPRPAAPIARRLVARGVRVDLP